MTRNPYLPSHGILRGVKFMGSAFAITDARGTHFGDPRVPLYVTRLPTCPIDKMGPQMER